MKQPTEEEFKNNPWLRGWLNDWYYIHQPKLDKLEREFKERCKMQDKNTTWAGEQQPQYTDECEQWVKDMHSIATRAEKVKGNEFNYQTITIDTSVPPTYRIEYGVNRIPNIVQTLTILKEEVNPVFNEEAERILFKEWAKKEFGDVLEVWLACHPMRFGHFGDPKVQTAWETWLSCAKSKFEE